ncbi:MAG: TonB-dependent receptor [Pseudohongiella sp.]|nr:TonB-dependent receptor [Pseudohongiella sp.]
MKTERYNTAVTMKPCLLALAIGALMAAPASFAEPDRPTELVVTASGYEQKPADAPASVTVMSRFDLQNKPYTSLADALRDIEGIDVGSGQDKNGNISVTLRGLPSDYTLILIDGRRQSDVGDIGPNAFGNSQFMYMPPLESIERIEVVRGPMSTLYGADAIGGVINIITRRDATEWHGSTTVSGNFQQDEQFGDDRKADVYFTGPIFGDRVSVGIRGGFYERDESDPTYSDSLPLPDGSIWQDSGSFGDKKIVAAKNWNAGLTLHAMLNEVHRLSAELDIAKQRYDNTEGQTGTLDSAESLWRASAAGIIQPRVGYTPYQRVQRHQFVLRHEATFESGNLTNSLTISDSENLGRSLPLTVQERSELQLLWNRARADQGGIRTPVLTDAVRDQLLAEFLPRPLRALVIDNTLFDTRYDTSYRQHRIAVGGQYFNAEMEDGVFAMFGDGFQEGTTQDHRQWALFAEDSWALGGRTTWTIGARYDDHNIFGSQISPRSYLVFRPDSALTFKGGVSTGYKTPKPNQLFPGITGFGGQGVSPFVGTPELQPETSVNYEMAMYFDNNGRFDANVTVFHNQFKDKIVNQDNKPNCEVALAGVQCVDIGPGWSALGFNSFSQAANVDKAETTGSEMAIGYQFTDSLSLRANYTYTHSEIKSGADAGKPLVNTPRDMFNSTLQWQALPRLNVSLVSEIRSDRYRSTIQVAGPNGPEAQELFYKPYELFHLGASYEVSDKMRVNARVNNLLDDDLSGRTCTLAATLDTYSCTADYNTTEKGRSVWLSLTYEM